MFPKVTTCSLVVAHVLFGNAWARSSGPASPFSIVIDGGSTGSRLHVFEFVDDSENDTSDSVAAECVRRGSSRANVPLSAFGRLPSEAHQPLNATYVAEHLLPLFEYAATVVPPQYHNTTRVKYQATAGMRLLDEDEQEAVYDALYDGLMEKDTFVFRGMERGDIATLGGDLEGFYGAVAANYLSGIIDSEMRILSAPTDATDASSDGPIGALDMGGSSTQIVFHMNSGGTTETPPTCGAMDPTCLRSPTSQIPPQLNDDDFFKTSYLSYGVDQFRERLWDTLIEEHTQQAGELDDCCGSKFLPNPCANKGYELQWKGFTLFGTGETEECIRQVRRLIPHSETPDDDHHEAAGRVGGVEHPPIQGKFFAMSLYFFTLDSLRELSHPDEEAHAALNVAWPNPSIEELHNALDGLCSRSWKGDLEEIQHNSHKFTRAEVLPHRCFESVYMVTLLKDGFGFEPESRNITFTFLVDGSEVEWSLGMAIAMHAQDLLVASVANEADAMDANATQDGRWPRLAAIDWNSRSSFHTLFYPESL